MSVTSPLNCAEKLELESQGSQGRSASRSASSDKKSPSDPAGYREVPPRQYLTPEQSAALRKGPKVNIVVGPVGPATKVAVFGASLALLKQYSWLAVQQYSLQHESDFRLPHSVVGPVIWSYRYMLAGERDPPKETKFADIPIANLACLVAACEEMEYEHLANKAFNRLKYLLGTQGCSDPAIMATVFTRVPVLFERFAKSRASERMIKAIAAKEVEGVIETDSTYFSTLLKAGEFGDRLRSEIDSRKALLEKHGKYAFVTCYTCGHQGHSTKNCKTPLADYRGVAEVNIGDAYGVHQPVSIKYSQAYREPPTCYNCNKVGHIARNCKDPKGSPPKAKRGGHRGGQRLEPIQVTGNGEGISTCDYEVKRGQFTRTGLQI